MHNWITIFQQLKLIAFIKHKLVGTRYLELDCSENGNVGEVQSVGELTDDGLDSDVK